MSQVDVSKLVSKLRYNLKERRKLSNPKGPQGRHDKIRKTVTALFKYERIELSYSKADESRGYAERLISDAIRYGDCHKETMEMASYWLLEKQLVHKLFKVLVPRYEKYSISYTKLWKVPSTYDAMRIPKCILELRGNIYPALGPDKRNHQNLLHNILLDEAKKHYYKEKALKIIEGSNKDFKDSEVAECASEKEISDRNNQVDAKEVLNENLEASDGELSSSKESNSNEKSTGGSEKSEQVD